jgi:hypothetical protein
VSWCILAPCPIQLLFSLQATQRCICVIVAVSPAHSCLTGPLADIVSTFFCRVVNGNCLLFQSFPQLHRICFQVFYLVFVQSWSLFMMSWPCDLRGKIKNAELTVQRLKQNEVVMFTSCQQMQQFLVLESHKRSSSIRPLSMFLQGVKHCTYMNAAVMFMVTWFASIKVPKAGSWGYNS